MEFKMKKSGFGFGGHSKGRRYLPDNDWEVAEEISPDPFSEEEHSQIHARRFVQPKYNNKKIKEKTNNPEHT